MADEETFVHKLKQMRQSHAERTAQEMRQIREEFAFKEHLTSEQDLWQRLLDLEQAQPPSVPTVEPHLPAQVMQINNHRALARLDQIFLAWSGLERVYDPQPLQYPTHYCTTAAEFYEQPLALLNLTAAQRSQKLKEEILRATRLAAESNGQAGVFGMDIPGKGCYLNGWLFGYKFGCSPPDCWQNPNALREILGTAVHEKLGHGFLRAFSTIGKEIGRLGLLQYEIAQQIGVRFVDDPLFDLRLAQSRLIFSACRLVEEGWATWIEHSLVGESLGTESPAFPYTLEDILQAVRSQMESQFLGGAREMTLAALLLVFSAGWMQEGVEGLSRLRSALSFLTQVEVSVPSQRGKSAQPLVYALGQVLLSQAQNHWGANLIPYLVLIAANVNPQLEQVGVKDLEYFFQEGDPRIHPNTRLVALCHLKPAAGTPCSPFSLAQQARQELGFAAPQEFSQERKER